MVALLFGLPLLTAYYGANPECFFSAILPYLAVTVSISVYLIARSGFNPGSLSLGERSTFIAKFNSFPLFIILIPIIWTMALFIALSYVFFSTFPVPPPSSVMAPLGEAYIVLIIVASVLGFSRIIYRAFSVLHRIFEEKKYVLMVSIFSASFAVVYLLLVNQIIIAGFNVQQTAPAQVFGNGYPSMLAMTPATEQFVLDLVYLPIIIVQLSPQVNLILIPFEMVFVTVLSLLVGSNIAMAHYLITNSGLRCSTKGTALSTSGSILGLTATCPTCLAPTFVSVLFGGITSVTTVYSNYYGVVLPPVLSLGALLLSVVYLSRKIRSLVAI